MGIYSATTHDIEVVVEPIFIEEESDPETNHYVWAYRIVIENKGAQSVRLRRRYWQITNGLGQVQEVEGEGVVGEQPILEPGGSFEYTSGAPLMTPSGIMVGSYKMETDSGSSFDVAIPAFSLDSPFDLAAIH